MEKPVYLKQETYDLIITALRGYSDEVLRKKLVEYGYVLKGSLERADLIETVLISPAPFLHYELDILGNKDLLKNTVINFNDNEADAGVDYLIDEIATDQIAEVGNEIRLIRLIDKKSISVPLERIQKYFKDPNAEIDHIL